MSAHDEAHAHSALQKRPVCGWYTSTDPLNDITIMQRRNEHIVPPHTGRSRCGPTRVACAHCAAVACVWTVHTAGNRPDDAPRPPRRRHPRTPGVDIPQRVAIRIAPRCHRQFCEFGALLGIYRVAGYTIPARLYSKESSQKRPLQTTLTGESFQHRHNHTSST